MYRLLALALLFSAAPAVAQAPPPPIPSVPVQAETDADIEAAVAEAIAAATAALADSTAPEAMMSLSEEEMDRMETEMEAALDSLDMGLQMMMQDMATAMAEGLADGFATSMGEMHASGASGPRLVEQGPLFSARGPQTYPAIPDVYGSSRDGFPDQTRISGVVVAAGSQRLCRAGRPAVSRWLKVRLTNTPASYPPVYMIVAVECDELDSRHYVGRRVSMQAWRAIPSRPVRMARNDVPEVDAPMYLTYPGNVTIES